MSSGRIPLSLVPIHKSDVRYNPKAWAYLEVGLDYGVSCPEVEERMRSNATGLCR